MEESLSSFKIQPIAKRSGPLSSNAANPLMGISTRSKSRTSSSAVSGPDPVCKPVADAESVEDFLGLSCTEASRASSIKDLRMKRVFTPGVNSDPREGTEEEKNEERKKLKVSDSDLDTVKVNELEKPWLMKPEVDGVRNGVANGPNSKDLEISGSKMALNRSNSRKVFKAAGSFSYRRLLPYLMDIANDASGDSKIEIVDGVKSEGRSTVENSKIEGDDSKASENHIQKSSENDINGGDASMEEELIQMTPPDPGMFAKTAFENGAESLEDKKLLSENQTSMGKQSPNAKYNTNSVNRPVLNPCSRLRLFNNSRSLSYRRMLPFLMDISKDNSCATMNTQHPTLQKSVLEKDNHVNTIEADNSCEKQYTQDLDSFVIQLPPLPPLDNPSLDTTDISSNLESNVVISETLPEEISQTQSTPTKSELGLELKDATSQSEPSSIVNDVLTKQCASEEPESVEKEKMCLDTEVELDNSNAESVEKVDLNQNSFKIRAILDNFVRPNNRLSKGILKRNPLGCRGLCNCLNCASFRLHADRAFEFSKNQMHNAEEVASDLMEELANLRILLEKSVTKNDSVDIQLNPNLVKQACDKALEAEKLAKERLIELNYDLGVHCRVPALIQPKVAFANNNGEQAILVMDVSTSAESKV